MNIIRAISTSDVSIDTVNKANRFVDVDGRPDETLTIEMVQHYGFKSMPIKDVEFINYQFQNNNISVAENDGNILQSLDLVTGDVVLYVDDKNYIYIHADGKIEIESEKDIIITNSGKVQFNSDGEIDITSQGQVNINNGNLTVDA
jgi:phage gp45-like